VCVCVCMLRARPSLPHLSLGPCGHTGCQLAKAASACLLLQQQLSKVKSVARCSRARRAGRGAPK
jgi:hypothetical protein